MNHVAKSLDKTPEEIKEINFYKKGQVNDFLHIRGNPITTKTASLHDKPIHFSNST